MKMYDELLKDFKEKKSHAEYIADINLKNALSHNDLKTSYDTIRSLQLDYAKARFTKKDTTEIADSIRKEKENLNKILKKHNIDTTTLKPQYECKRCNDTGIINNEMCDCFKAELSKKLLVNCGLNYNNLPDFDKMSYDIVKNQEEKDRYIKTCELFKKYISKLNGTEKKLILLSGEVGVGKTHILKATTHEAIKNGYYSLYTTAFDLNKAFLNYHCASLDKKEEIISKYLQCDLLLIDDLGTENILKNVTIEYLYLVINQRLESNKNTIITTNLNLEELKNIYDERIMSRLANKQTCITTALQGSDLRWN